MSMSHPLPDRIDKVALAMKLRELADRLMPLANSSHDFADMTQFTFVQYDWDYMSSLYQMLKKKADEHERYQAELTKKKQQVVIE